MSFTVPTDISSRPVAVIGAGTLGRRIALMFAAHGAAVTIYDLADTQRRAALDYVTQELPGLASRLTDVVPGKFRSMPISPTRSATRGWLSRRSPSGSSSRSRSSANSTSSRPPTPYLPAIRRHMPAGCSWTRSSAPNVC